MTSRPLLLAPLLFVSVACTAVDGADPTASRDSSRPELRFRDIAVDSGVDDRHWWGNFRRGRILNTVGGGVAWGDYDGDGDLDLALSQGVSRPSRPRHRDNCARLYRNDHRDDGSRRLVDVTDDSGLHACGWGYGVLFEDLDADGDLDLHLTYLGPDQLWLNRGDGGFEEVGAGHGLADADFHSGAAALDFDRDGDLDLYVVGYLDTSVAVESARRPFEIRFIDDYGGVPDRLYEQVDGRFFDASERLPDETPIGRGLGVVAADLDADGWTDLYVANDRHRNTLLANRGGERFEDVTAVAGVGYGLTGEAESGMGIGAGDVDGDGRLDLLVTNFAREPADLYANLGRMTFVDRSRESGVYATSHAGVGWAVGLPDFDNDGLRDQYLAHGHLLPHWMQKIARLVDRSDAVRRDFIGPYRQPLALLRGIGDGRFRPVEPIDGSAPIPPGVWRGGDAADVDGDGRVDLFLYSANPRVPSRLLVNRTLNRNGWTAIRLRRPGQHPPVAGTRVLVTGRIDGERGGSQTLQVVSGGSYLSGSAVDLHAGLGSADVVGLELRRPGGRTVRVRRLPIDRIHVF